MTDHKPPKTSYLLGSITGNSSGYDFSLPAAADNGYWDNGTFPVRLYAVKVNNDTKTLNGQYRARVEIKLVAKDVDGQTKLETQSIVSGWSEGTEISGGWMFVPNGTRTIEVYARAPNASSWGSALRTVTVSVVGDKVVLNNNSGWAMSREYDHVYYETVMIVDNKVEAERYGRVEWSDGTQTASIPSVMAPKRGLPSTTPVSLDPSEYGKTGGETPKIVRFYSDSGFDNEKACFHVFDVGGNEVTILAEGNDAASAPYAVTPASEKIKVVNQLTSTVYVWPMGWKQGASNSTGQPISGTPTGNDYRDFEFTVVTPTTDDTDVGKVPYRGPGPAGDTTVFTRAHALNWQSTGDPKIVIRQDTRGEKGRGH